VYNRNHGTVLGIFGVAFVRTLLMRALPQKFESFNAVIVEAFRAEMNIGLDLDWTGYGLLQISLKLDWTQR